MQMRLLVDVLQYPKSSGTDRARALAHLTGIKPPAPLGSFLAEDQFNPTQSTRLLDSHHRTEESIDFAVDDAFRGGVAHGGEGHIEDIERHGRYDAKETVEEDRT